MEELCEESFIYGEGEFCGTTFKCEDDLWNNTSSQFYASTDYYVNNFTNLSEFERDDKEYLKKPHKFDSLFGEKPLKNPLVNEENFEEKKVVFVVNKRHNYKCRHLANVSKSVRKNKIRLCFEDDFQKIIANNFEGMKNNFYLLFKKIAKIKSFEKCSKNRKFRLFDKDVIIKKIICHFYKFISSLTSFIEKHFKYKIKLNDTIRLKKRSQTSFKSIISLKICQLDEKIPNQNIPQSLQKIVSLTCVEIYKKYFINSSYFQEITENFKIKHGDVYYQYFLNLSSEFPDCIYSKGIKQKKHNK